VIGSSIKQAGDVPVGVPVRVRAVTSVSADTTPKRDRHAPYVYAISGRVQGAFAVDAATCSGTVRISVRRGTHTLVTRTPRLDAHCRYHGTIRISGRKLPVHRSTRLTAAIRFLGSGNLEPSSATRRLTAH
jgi:hypothetical protein